MTPDIQPGDVLTLRNREVGTARSRIGPNSCGFPIVSAQVGRFWIPVPLDAIVQVERDGRVIWDEAMTELLLF